MRSPHAPASATSTSPRSTLRTSPQPEASSAYAKKAPTAPDPAIRSSPTRSPSSTGTSSTYSGRKEIRAPPTATGSSTPHSSCTPGFRDDRCRSPRQQPSPQRSNECADPPGRLQGPSPGPNRPGSQDGTALFVKAADVSGGALRTLANGRVAGAVMKPKASARFAAARLPRGGLRAHPPTSSAGLPRPPRRVRCWLPGGLLGLAASLADGALRLALGVLGCSGRLLRPVPGHTTGLLLHLALVLLGRTLSALCAIAHRAHLHLDRCLITVIPGRAAARNAGRGWSGSAGLPRLTDAVGSARVDDHVEPGALSRGHGAHAVQEQASGVLV